MYDTPCARLHRFGTGFLFWAVLACMLLLSTPASAELVQIVFTSDQHYGIERKQFRNHKKVSATQVNAALVQAINQIPELSFPPDGGVRAGQAVQWIDYVISTGDIANRMEGTDEHVPPTAQACWDEFVAQYINGITLKNRKGQKPEVLVVPGNHDMTNAIGFYRPLVPERDSSALRAMYNRATGKDLTAEAFEPYRDRVVINRKLDGVSLLLVGLWPDSTNRAWLDQQIRALPAGQSALLFTHMPPNITANRLTNPNGERSINAKDKFENLISDVSSVLTVQQPPIKERKELETFVRQHPAVSAYFHGHENFNEFYDWQGPDYTVSLPTFRVDSPMKGDVSAADECELSFLVITLDTATRSMTVRQALWNASPSQPQVTWAQTRTVPLTGHNPKN